MLLRRCFQATEGFNQVTVSNNTCVCHQLHMIPYLFSKLYLLICYFFICTYMHKNTERVCVWGGRRGSGYREGAILSTRDMYI